MGGNTKTPRRLALGAALREEREAAGVSVTRFASTIGVSPAAISRWETGDRRPQPTDVARFLSALGVTGDRYEEILGLASDVDAPYWIAISLPEQRQHLNALLRFERDAQQIVDVTPLLVTGLLQEEAYIRAIMTAAHVPEDEIESRIRVRLGRQKVLETVRLQALIGEAVLHQEIGGRVVLANQLRHLAKMSDHPNVDLRVIPFTAGWVPSLGGGWTVIESTVAPTVILLESQKSGQFLHEDADVAMYRDAVSTVIGMAMSPEQSLGLIAKRIEQLEMR
jgi:transcriptional regulator with XRE-family HTH domain